MPINNFLFTFLFLVTPFSSANPAEGTLTVEIFQSLAAETSVPCKI